MSVLAPAGIIAPATHSPAPSGWGIAGVVRVPSCTVTGSSAMDRYQGPKAQAQG